MINRILIACLVITISTPVFAQPGPPMGRPPRGEIREKIRTMKIWKMTEELDLTEEQATRFFPLLNEMENKIDEIHEQKRMILEDLGEQVWKTNPEAGKITDLIEKAEVLETQIIDLRNQFRTDASKILNTVQLGKMVLFNQHFPQIMRDLIKDFEKGPPFGAPGKPPGGRNQW